MFDDATTVRPLEGTFDVDLVSAWLRALPFTRQNGSEFLIAESYEEEDAATRTRMLIIDVAPDQIVVATRTAPTAPALELVRWLERRWRVEVTGDPLAVSSPRVCRRRARVEDNMMIERAVGDFVVTQRLFGTADRGVFAGYEREHERDVLFTINTPPRADAPPPRAHRTKGIARLRYVGSIGEHPGVLIEDEPPGTAVGPVRLPETIALKYAKELLWIVEDANEPLGGLAPHLVYAENGSITEVAPRAQEFIASGSSYCYGVPTLFTTSYLAPEIITGKGYDEAADVFAAGIILSYWLTGEHPFAGNHERLISIMMNQRRPWVGSPELGRVVDSMLSPNPVDRPLAVEAIHALE